jgi:hypothetical protein
MWLLQLAAVVYLVSVLWPYAKRLKMPRFGRPTIRGVIVFCAYAWIVLWVIDVIITASLAP